MINMINIITKNVFSMQKGEFDVIKGKGKPLKPGGADNPHTDFMTAKINEILINNGYQPEWVELGKEIRKSSQEAKDRYVPKDLLSTRVGQVRQGNQETVARDEKQVCAQ